MHPCMDALRPRSGVRDACLEAQERKKLQPGHLKQTLKNDNISVVSDKGLNPTAWVCSRMKRKGSAVLRNIVQST